MFAARLRLSYDVMYQYKCILREETVENLRQTIPSNSISNKPADTFCETDQRRATLANSSGKQIIIKLSVESRQKYFGEAII
jgi:hypothetical protein